MTETEWKLRKELAHTKLALFQAHSKLVEIDFSRAKEEFDALGEKWVAPVDNVVELKQDTA